ncbi:MAG: gluconate transporter [Flavobacteriaceae bacterium]|jgi:Gnt-I system low-affinity gluconate transporter|nr:gluconate transporter [Flavobacteriaceae bacterium]NVJ72824.1 gluconate transporter [Flavobacteriaceae bacterium]
MVTTLLLALVLGITVLLFLILKLKIPAFISLLISTIIIGIVAGLDASSIFDTIQRGMGGTLGYVATIVGLGAMFGSILELTGSAQAIADYMLKRFGVDKAPWTLLFSGFFIAIPVFFDVAFILLIPVIYALQHRTKKSLLLYAIPLLAGLAVTHAFIPPTPGPVAVADILGADLGLVILMGFLVGLPAAVVSGIFFGRYISNKIFVEAPSHIQEDSREKPLPSISVIFGVVLVPIVLIVLRALIDSGVILDKNFGIGLVITYIGHPFAALIIGNLLAWCLLGLRWNYSKEELFKVASKSMEPAGTIILLTGAGGVLKQMLVDTNIGTLIAESFVHLQSSIYLIAFIIAVLIRVLQGSSTVAMITAAGLVAPLLESGQYSGFALALLVVAIASGASTFSHVNDSGFWLVSQYLGINEKQTYRSWTMMTTVLSLVGIVVVLLFALFI